MSESVDVVVSFVFYISEFINVYLQLPIAGYFSEP